MYTRIQAPGNERGASIGETLSYLDIKPSAVAPRLLSCVSAFALSHMPFGTPITVGEWSLATDNCAMWLNGFQDNLPGFPQVWKENFFDAVLDGFDATMLPTLLEESRHDMTKESGRCPWLFCVEPLALVVRPRCDPRNFVGALQVAYISRS